MSDNEIVRDLDRQIDFHTRQLMESKIHIARLKAAKACKLENFKFLKSQNDGEKMLRLLDKVPQIRSLNELQIIFMVGQMKSNKEMANEMFVSEKTIKYHKTNIFRKLNVKNEKELFAKIFNNDVSDELPVSSID